MCGIAAIYSPLQNDRTFFKDKIEQMTSAMIHRGPDGQGHYIDDHIALGHRRLSILDLSDAGSQPMFSKQDGGRYVISFNGEIYNYKALNALLEKKGYKTYSTCDTETVLNLYACFGEGCLSYLEGMFAFVIWDLKEKTLFAARDRFGQKPLLFSNQNGHWYFASELKAFLKSKVIAPLLDTVSAAMLIETGSVIQPRSIISGVFHLQAGHAMKIENGKERIWQYWDLAFSQQESEQVDYQTAKEKLNRLFIQAVESHIISDVPLGVFLSGGIDSSLIAAAMKLLGKNVQSFSLGFDSGGKNYNETEYASIVSKHLGTNHTEVILSEHDVVTALPDFIRGIDQPSSDGLNTFLVSKLAKEKVTVALSGLGSDEIFAGYSTFKFYQFLRDLNPFLTATPRALSLLAGQIGNRIPERLSEHWIARGAIGLMGGYNEIADLYSTRHLTSFELSRKIFGLPYNNGNSLHFQNYYLDALKKAGLLNSHPIHGLSYLEAKMYLCNTLLRDSDSTSMAHSLELRVPFLDHQFASYAAMLPAEFKIDRNSRHTGKKILIDSLGKLIPDEVIKRKKMGFALPLAYWMRKGRLNRVIRQSLSESSVKKLGICSQKEVDELLGDFFSSGNEKWKFRSYLRVWTLSLLHQWMLEYGVTSSLD
ncbi:MAG: asparagine synthase (glutamine-hydrolyzing) [Chloroherpetonaceae bacterium]|nr:asparagine synthase (glutamine-hydrolyzing) [Chloroherpetonaceae bacterium]